MARARNIKPSFFDNDELAEISALGRLFFIALWTVADYNGNVEWREKKLKAKLLPYDNCDIKEIAINLERSGFIRFYADNDKICLHICNFTKHQNPHKNERDKGAELSVFSEDKAQVIDLTTLTINRDLSRINTKDSSSNRADSFNLIPDSFNLIPEPLNTANQNLTETPNQDKAQIKNRFAEFWLTYPKKTDKKKALAAFTKIKPDDLKFKRIMSGLAKQIEWRKQSDGAFKPEWKNPTTWLNGENWNDEIPPTPQAASNSLSRIGQTMADRLANLELN
ncbi:hypothetical protein ACOI22_03480 [Glaciecola sp. 2405UD65-10]|uniref:hypothetical protein n=1 Tax=Glaciecola sp. 2405UD65-10 TaxID=3397244 RepID=UPI003B5BDA49